MTPPRDPAATPPSRKKPPSSSKGGDSTAPALPVGKPSRSKSGSSDDSKAAKRGSGTPRKPEKAAKPKEKPKKEAASRTRKSGGTKGRSPAAATGSGGGGSGGSWRGRAERGLRRLRDALLGLILLGTAVPAAQAALLNVVNPPLTLTMVGRSWETWRAGGGLHLPEREWVALDKIPDHVVQAAISSEDAHFFTHSGFDWDAIEQAMGAYNPGESTGGGSSISQQTAKNVFLWQGRSWLRKGLEVWYTFWMELLVPKARIMEVYLNVAETGPMTFGVQAGARHWFQRDVSTLAPDQSARMICVLPAPTRWSVSDERVQRRARRIVAQPSPIPPRWRENILPQSTDASD